MVLDAEPSNNYTTVTVAMIFLFLGWIVTMQARATARRRRDGGATARAR